MINLAAFYTMDKVSRILVDNLSTKFPDKILDLGIGGGSLTKAAHNRWKDAEYYASDIDHKVKANIEKNLPFVKFSLVDSLNLSLPKKLALNDEVVDVAICNPPYLKVPKSKIHNELFDKAGLNNCKNLKVLSTDLIFLAQNLNLLKKGGEMGIIVPDGLITNLDFLLFRESLLLNHNLKGVISLPEKVFKKTEAKTHILLIEKGGSSNNQIPLFKSSLTGDLGSQVEINSSDLLKRMDFDHYDWKLSFSKNEPFKKLSTTVESISRGRISYKELRESSLTFLHTTNITHGEKIYGKKQIFKSAHRVAKRGDIVMARVGRNCIGKVSLIEEGEFVISDCIYRIRPKKEFRLKIWESLTSKHGKSWLKGFSHGVCAKVISKADLLNFPVFF